MPPAPDADRPSLRSILDGFRYVKRRKVLLGIFVVDTNAMIFGMPRALFPAFAEKLGGGAGVLGVLYAAPFFGALLASLTSGWMMTLRRQGLGVCIAAAVWGVAIAVVGFAEAVWFALSSSPSPARPTSSAPCFARTSSSPSRRTRCAAGSRGSS